MGALVMAMYDDIKSDAFSCEVINQSAILTLRKRAFSVNFDTCHLSTFLECLNKMEMDENIRGVILMDTPEYHGVENVKNFIELLHNTKGSYQKEKGVTRYGNSSKRLTLTLNEFSKPIIVGIEGQVPIDSFGYFLACDRIIAAENVSIEFPGLDLNVLPIGAVGFYLEREVGPNATLDMFLSGRPIAIEEAKSKNLVHEVCAVGNVRQACLDKLESYYAHSEEILMMSKQLLKARSYDLEAYFERSMRIMWNAVLNR